MQVETTPIPGLVVLKPRRFTDDRGHFAETYNQRTMAEGGIRDVFVQDNESVSRHSDTIRGLHLQIPPAAQAKLVRVPRGAVLDVAVDVRLGSPTYMRSFSIELSSENGKQLYIPIGFLHGFRTLQSDTIVNYKINQYYKKECDVTIDYADAELAVDWGGMTGTPILSQKDAAGTALKDFRSPFWWDD